MKRLGIDIGSLSISTVLLDDDRVIESDYREVEGDVAGAMAAALLRFEPHGFDRVGITGNFQRSARVLDNALCVIRGARYLLPGCRNVISVGGQNYMLVFYDEDGTYREHTLNPPCAAGTGSFLAQQAERLGLSPRELSEKALAFQGKVPTIATRCAVFAKSDIIHCMQEGFAVDAICAGLCEGLGRSVVDALVKGRVLSPAVGIVGGVAQNAKVVDSIRRGLGLEVMVPERPWAAGAIGAALLGEGTSIDRGVVTGAGRPRREQRPTLQLRLSDYPDFPVPQMIDDVEVVAEAESVSASCRDFTLGIDIGSTSTKAALLGETGEVVCGLYTATRGAPVDAVRRILRALHQTVPGWAGRVRKTATTGSGRKMIKELFCADLEVNEITAHARAASFLHPMADTIIEIGGQDSKFTRLHNGQVSYSTMNYVCAAGTGSFIEEQARRLGVSLAEMSELALGRAAPYTSDRCTVYMERDLNVLLGEGSSRDAVLASVLFSVRDNYLSKVVNRHPIGAHVVFQGATARNKALVAAFEQHLGVPIHVSRYCHLTGAIGVALIAQEEPSTRSAFRTDDLELTLVQEPCSLCTNQCVLSVVRAEGRSSAWGMKCGREYDERQRKSAASLSALERRRVATPPSLEPGTVPRGTIGLADSLYHKEYNALWRDMLTRLGFKVVVARNGKKSLSKGKSLVNSDFCAPIILAHGAIQDLHEKKLDAIFYPSILNECGPAPEPPVSFRAKTTDSYYCYYSQYAPTLLGNLTTLALEDQLVAPLLSLRSDSPERTASLIHEALSRRFPGLQAEEVKEHFLAAWENMLQRQRARREQRPPLDADGINVVFAGRPYVVFEQAVSLGIPRLFEERNATLFYQDEFDTDAVAMESRGPLHERMHWAYGKKILAMAEIAARTPNLFLVFLSCFRCSPDSFLMSYVKELMEAHGKPFLVLQLDEHSSDVGYTTRIEAALRTFESHRKAAVVPGRKESTPESALAPGDTVLIPYVNRLISSFWSECFRLEGYDTRVLENSERVLHTGYRHANGGECMPAVAIAGGVIEQILREKLDPSKTFLYLPTVCMACNFPQFPTMAAMAAEAAGIRGLKAGRINFLNPGEVLPGLLGVRMFETSVIAGLVYKLYHRVRPYERQAGATDQAFEQAEAILVQALRQREGLRKAFSRVTDLFRSIERDESLGRKPRIAVLGDMYVKYNEVVNQNVTRLIEELGGEIVVPSLTEMTCHFLDVDVRAGIERPQAVKVIEAFEARYEKVAADLIGDDREPEWESCVGMLEQHGFAPSIAGETSINLGRALHWISNGLVDAIVHLNPMFCCPGVVSASLFRKLQAQYGIPIIDIFYDGTGDPNRVLIPHLASLVGKRRATAACRCSTP